jgi:beta-fructofuranosidase
MAVSKDAQFNQWEKLPENPVIKSTEWGITEIDGKTIYGSADPSNIWMNNGNYYMLTGNLLVLNKYGRQPDASASMQGDRTYLFRSKNLRQWEYMHPFYESDRKWTDQSEDNMCPSFLPLPATADGGKSSGKHLMLFISHNKGCQYYTGTYKNDHFYPETHGRMTWFDNAYFAPEALVDGRGRQIMWAWIFDDRPDQMKNYSGWTGVYGLPRSLWLGEDGALRMQPVEELKMLRMEERSKSGIQLKSGGEVNLDNFGSDLMELEIVMEPDPSANVHVAVCRSDDGKEETVLSYQASSARITCDASRSSLKYGRLNTEAAPFELRNGEPLTLRIFVDRSVVEVFANDRQAIGRAIYPTLGGKGIRIRSENGNVKIISFKAWELAPANPY